MAKNDVQVNFRMPLELKSRLEKAATDNNRSLTAEIVSRLELTLDQSISPVALSITEDIVERVVRKIREEERLSTSQPKGSSTKG